MIELDIDNSECILRNLPIAAYRDLREILAYPIEIRSRTGALKGYKPKYLIDKDGIFPTGLLYLVQEYLSKKFKCEEILTDDRRYVPNRLESIFTPRMSVTPYPEQIEAGRAARIAKRGILVMPTGTGKSLVSALIANELQVPTLIVTPTLGLKQQLTDSLTEIFGKDRVGLLGSPLAIENVDALDPNKPLKGYGCVIIDEFHHGAASTYRELNRVAWKDVYYKFGLTATPFRSNDNERLLLESVLSKVIYRLDYETSVKKNYIVPLEAYYYEVPRIKPKSQSWKAVYSELVVKNEPRNSLIKSIVSLLLNAKKAVLCLVKEVQHGEAICTGEGWNFVKGENDDNHAVLTKFNKRNVQVIIGTTGVIGEGIDTKPAEYVIIAGLGRSKNAFMQQCGRVLRKHDNKQSGKVIIFLDRSHRWLISHFKEQCKILLDEYNVVPIKLD